jgi:DUF971 family protein
MTISTAAPTTIDVDRERGVTLTWPDGLTSRFELEQLRVHCPCASCRTRREGGLTVWPLPGSPQPLTIVEAELIGAWGLGFTWNDGHSTGIYNWDLLRPATRHVTIDPRFCGPSDRGNGGYTAGLLAREMGTLVEVTLRLPSPLRRPLKIRVGADGHGMLLDGEDVVAEAEPIESVEVAVPAPVTPDHARAAAARSDRHDDGIAFERCFSCGPERAEGDGLRIFAGPVEGRDVYAAPWRPGAELANATGHVEAEILWAALDCAQRAPVAGREWAASVLGRIAVQQLAPVPVERDLVVMSWLVGVEGRKGFAADALLTEDGAVLAVSRSTWIRPRQP